jgi:hypothetical protein
MKNKLKMKALTQVIPTLMIAFFGASCTKKTEKQSSELVSLNKEVKEDLTAKLNSPGALCDYIKEGNFFPSNEMAAGTMTYFSTSYQTDEQNTANAEKGQAIGKVSSDGRFELVDFVTTQILICPGAFGGLYAGKCLWKINGPEGYLELAKRVACNTARTYGSPMKFHPGYNAQKVKRVKFNASTAGKNVSYDDALEIELLGEKSGGFIYFAKDLGLVATEFRESLSPSGTAKVYFDVNKKLGLIQ